MTKILNAYGYKMCVISCKDLKKSLSLYETEKLDGFSFSSHQIDGPLEHIINSIPHDVKAISMTGIFSNSDYLHLSNFKNLEYLSADFKTFPYQHESFPELKVYLGAWPSENKMPHSFSLLEILYADAINITSRAVEHINSMKYLKNLTLSRCKGGDLNELECELESFTLGFSKNVTTVENVCKSRKMREISIYNCPNLKFSGRLIRQGTNLETIELTKINEIDSFEFCRYAENLKVLTFDGTPVRTKDISELTRCKKLIHLYGKLDKKFTPPLQSIILSVKNRQKDSKF